MSTAMPVGRDGGGGGTLGAAWWGRGCPAAGGTHKPHRCSVSGVFWAGELPPVGSVGSTGLCQAAPCHAVGWVCSPAVPRGQSTGPLPPCPCHEWGSVCPAAPLAGEDVWLPTMKGLFRRPPPSPRQETGAGAGGGQPSPGHTISLCAGHLGRHHGPLPPSPPTGARGYSRATAGARSPGWAAMPCVPPAPQIPAWDSHRLSSSHSQCPEPAGCPQPALLPPTAPTGLASPLALEHDQTRGPSLLGAQVGEGLCQNTAGASWQLARCPAAPMVDTGWCDAGSSGRLPKTPRVTPLVPMPFTGS